MQECYRYVFCTHGRIRTCDRLLRRQLLYPLSYVGHPITPRVR